jgi:fucose 4-O-acetylase-like acetyltransferase
MAYNDSGWWPVENGFSITVGLLTTLTDGVLMPGLFYISGYFAVPSISRKGGQAFIMGKLRRLGIPWLLCSLFVCPILPLVYHYTHDGMQLTRSYLITWLKVMGNAVGLDTGILPPMARVMQNDLFYQRYMWFISVLILFFFIFSLVYRVKRDWFASRHLFYLGNSDIQMVLDSTGLFSRTT